MLPWLPLLALLSIYPIFKPSTPGIWGCKLKSVNFKLISTIAILNISRKIAIWWMPQDLTGDYLIMGQVMAWCFEAISHYLSQRSSRSMSPYGAIRPQWVKSSHCDSFEDRAPNFIYGCPIFKWVAETLLHGSLSRYVKVWVAHGPRMPRTFSPPLISKETAS